MANWGEFIKEFKILNLKSQGIYVQCDEVLDMYDERARLREEVAELKAIVANVREKCAQEIETLARACAGDPTQPDNVAPILQVAADLVRSGGQVPVAEAVEGDEAAALAEAGGDIPMAEPMSPAEEK